MKNILFLLLFHFLLTGCANTGQKKNIDQPAHLPNAQHETAVFAGGCFWCIESAFLDINGVDTVISGFSGGHVKNPTYEQVCTGTTGHLEAVKIVFDPRIVSYAELVDVFWRQFDPTDDGGSFHDRGSQYRSALFVMNAQQRTIAETSKQLIGKSGVFDKPVATSILQFDAFYPAEEYHQQYCIKNPTHYYMYRAASGRDEFIRAAWGDLHMTSYTALSDAERERSIIHLRNTTLPVSAIPQVKPGIGIFVDVKNGQPLFCSNEMLPESDSGYTFTKPIDARLVEKIVRSDQSSQQIIVASKTSLNAVGYLVQKKNSPTGLLYAVNPALVRFVPKNEMVKEKYGAWLWLLK